MFSVDELNEIDKLKNRQPTLDYFLRYWYIERDSYYFHIRFIFFCWFNACYGKSEGYNTFETKYVEEKGWNEDEILDGVSTSYLMDLAVELCHTIMNKFFDKREEDYMLDFIFSDMLRDIGSAFAPNHDEYRKITDDLVDKVSKKYPDNPIIKFENDLDYKPTPQECEYIKTVFPSESWFDSYLKNWFSNYVIDIDLDNQG